jgi:hypothetical protein
MWLAPTPTLSPAQRTELEQTIAPFTSLQDVVRWTFSKTPPRDVSSVVVQDEYSHDVVVPWGPRFLAFDTT